MIPFKAPLDDILYSLNAVARADDAHDFDAGLHAEIAQHFATFAEGELAPLNAIGDQEGARLLNGRVTLPDGFRAAYAKYCDQGWPALCVPEAFGGQGMGPAALGITSEIFAGANHGFEMTTGLAAGAVRTLAAFGTDAQQQEMLPKLASGAWLSTMALTEPGAGSDLSRIKCRAVQTASGWQIDGEKIFISGGDQDVSDGIVHLVLARSGAAGLDGLSLFVCKSTRADGTRNGANVIRIEDKLGIHASPTCQLRFDAAEAELLGVEGQGLGAMFTMMNHARLSVALQGVAHAARATAIARSYAQDRIQGKEMPIARHPDVARMLDEMDLRAVGARGIAHLALVMLENDDAPDLLEVLTPVAKYFCTEVASQAADIGIQVLGGYGFLEEYGMAQILRDARICRIYEGANGIHALSLATRLVRMGAPLEALDAFATDCPSIAAMHAAWRTAWHGLRAAEDARPFADAFMTLTSEMVHQIVWARIAETVDQHPDPERLKRLAARARPRFDVQLSHYNAELAIYSPKDA